MAIVGFNFTKMLVEKKGSLQGKININNNIALTNAKEMDVSLGGKDTKGMLIQFEYSCIYEPNLGKILLEGDIITMESPETIKSSIELWQKKKTVGKGVLDQVMPYLLNKSSIQAIILSKDASLPSPVPLPKINTTAATGGVSASSGTPSSAKQAKK